VEPDYVRAHKHSIWHREQLAQSDRCGCFYCLSIFGPDEIEEWVDEQDGAGTTALCPKCGIDSVIGSASGFPIETAFLRSMRGHWFG
jgi:hypothetical protein